ncbi:MAG: hypothetical protein RLY31_2219 [Bacteroidota bacterium]|jgi:rRNA maturation RNase YbeY
MQEFPVFPASDSFGISFCSEDVDFDLPLSEKVSDWLSDLIRREACQLRTLQFVFCSDVYLSELNVEYLRHDTLTDIITFPYANPPLVEGDVFISIERVRENARSFGTVFEDELRRVMAHGVLHLCGFGDKTGEEALLMRRKEEEALQAWQAFG